MTTLNEQRILEIVNKNLKDSEKAKAIIYWNKDMLSAGQTVKMGRKKVQMPFNGYMIYVDLEPQANWGHPVLYLLINPEKDVDHQVIKGEFPPFTDSKPKNFKIVKQ